MQTDFVLSAEIIVIALGTVSAVPFATRPGVLVGIALRMTVGVYGLVAAIVGRPPRSRPGIHGPDDSGLSTWPPGPARRRHGLAAAVGYLDGLPSSTTTAAPS